MSDIEVAARLIAEEIGQAVRMTWQRPFPVSSRPMIVIPIQLAGETPNLMAVGIGNGVDPVRIGFCPEPRNPDLQRDLLLRLGNQMRVFVDDWDADPSLLPQVVTPSRAAARLFLAVVNDMNFRPGIEMSLMEFGRRVYYFDQSFERPDSGALLDIPSALAELYATGQDEHADQHLGAFLEWLRPADGRIYERVEEAEGMSASVSTDPDIDNQYLVPLSEELREAREAGDEAAAAHIAEEMRSYLVAEITRRYRLVRRGLEAFSDFPDSEVSEDIRAADRERYDRHRVRAADMSKRISRGLKSTHGALQFLDREMAKDRIDALKARSVSGARAAARLSGEIVVGEVLSRVEFEEDGTLLVEYDILSQQFVLAIRPGDELVLLDGERPFEFEVDEIEKDGDWHIVRAHLKGLKTMPGQPQIGDMIELGRPVQPRERMRRTMRVAKRRLWNVQPRPQVSGPVPQSQNLLEIALALRSDS